MSDDQPAMVIPTGTPPARAFAAGVERAMALTHAESIDIGANVWIATGATIIGGVTIGHRSVVAAGSVVTRDAPPDSLVGGNPARVIRSIAGE